VPNNDKDALAKRINDHSQNFVKPRAIFIMLDEGFIKIYNWPGCRWRLT